VALVGGGRWEGEGLVDDTTFRPPVISSNAEASSKNPSPRPTHPTSPSLPIPTAPPLLLYAGNEVVVEEFLDGEEASFFALIDGEAAVALASAQDHKAVGDGDTGARSRCCCVHGRGVWQRQDYVCVCLCVWSWRGQMCCFFCLVT